MIDVDDTDDLAIKTNHIQEVSKISLYINALLKSAMASITRVVNVLNPLYGEEIESKDFK